MASLCFPCITLSAKISSICLLFKDLNVFGSLHFTEMKASRHVVKHIMPADGNRNNSWDYFVSIKSIPKLT